METNSPSGNRSLNMLFIVSLTIISIAIGGTSGFIYGHIKGKATNALSLADAHKQVENIQEKNRLLTDEKANSKDVADEQDKLIATTKKDYEGRIANMQTTISELRANEQSLRNELGKLKQSLTLQNDANAPSIAGDVVNVESVKDSLFLYENPKRYVGKTVVVSNKIAHVIGDHFRRNTESNGYIFEWKSGETVSGAETIGNDISLQEDKLNFWCDTDTGIIAKEKLKGNYVGDSVYYHLVEFRFEIKKKYLTRFGRETEYYLAVLKTIEPKK
jgi:hypothetical protein